MCSCLQKSEDLILFPDVCNQSMNYCQIQEPFQSLLEIQIRRRISELLGKFEGGGGSEEEGNLAELDTGSNTFYGKEHSRKTLSPEDNFSSHLSSTSKTKSTYFSNHVETQILLIEHRKMLEDCDWLNQYPAKKLTANGKRKRKVDNDNIFNVYIFEIACHVFLCNHHTFSLHCTALIKT